MKSPYIILSSLLVTALHSTPILAETQKSHAPSEESIKALEDRLASLRARMQGTDSWDLLHGDNLELNHEI